MAKELINKNLVVFDAKAETAEDVIKMIAGLMEKEDRLTDIEGYIADVFKREKSSSTAIGFCVATPHAKSEHVKEPTLAFVRLKNKIKWDGVESAQMIFQIGVPSPGQGNRHLEILAALFRKIIHDDFREKLAAANSAEEVIELIGNV